MSSKNDDLAVGGLNLVTSHEGDEEWLARAKSLCMNKIDERTDINAGPDDKHGLHIDPGLLLQK